MVGGNVCMAPLAVSEVGGSGHQDVVGIALLLAGLLTSGVGSWTPLGNGSPVQTHGGNTPGRISHPWPLSCLRSIFTSRSDSSVGSDVGTDVGSAVAAGMWTGLCFGTAVAVKPVVVPLGLVVAWRLRFRRMWLASVAVTAGLTLIGLYLPFVTLDGGMSRLFDTADTFIETWSFNSSLHGLTMWMIGNKQIADAAMAMALVTGLAIAMGTGMNLTRLIQGYLFAFFLFSSTLIRGTCYGRWYSYHYGLTWRCGS